MSEQVLKVIRAPEMRHTPTQAALRPYMLHMADDSRENCVHRKLHPKQHGHVESDL